MKSNTMQFSQRMLRNYTQVFIQRCDADRLKKTTTTVIFYKRLNEVIWLVLVSGRKTFT